MKTINLLGAALLICVAACTKPASPNVPGGVACNGCKVTVNGITAGFVYVSYSKGTQVTIGVSGPSHVYVQDRNTVSLFDTVTTKNFTYTFKTN
jgi:hypothetical protein